MLCPNCGNELVRSRRRGFKERVIFRFLLMHALRCRRCLARFYSPPAILFGATGSGKLSPGDKRGKDDD